MEDGRDGEGRGWEGWDIRPDIQYDTIIRDDILTCAAKLTA